MLIEGSVSKGCGLLTANNSDSRLLFSILKHRGRALYILVDKV
jgi:hypothetical protein